MYLPSITLPRAMRLNGCTSARTHLLPLLRRCSGPAHRDTPQLEQPKSQNQWSRYPCCIPEYTCNYGALRNLFYWHSCCTDSDILLFLLLASLQPNAQATSKTTCVLGTTGKHMPENTKQTTSVSFGWDHSGEHFLTVMGTISTPKKHKNRRCLIKMKNGSNDEHWHVSGLTR